MALFSNNLWLNNAKHANAMAQLLANELKDVDEIDLAYPVQTNFVFARLNKKYIQELQKGYYFYVWNDATDEVRWMTSFATTPEEVKEFASSIKRVIKAG